jgi:hypothetical protein
MPREEDEGFDMGEVTYIKTSPSGKAMLVDWHGEEIWIPFSQVHNDSELHEDDTSGRKLVVSSWLAGREGWDG